MYQEFGLTNLMIHIIWKKKISAFVGFYYISLNVLNAQILTFEGPKLLVCLMEWIKNKAISEGCTKSCR